ncbi:MAG: DUF6989 domain-containing protein [Promethearchaeota archaeon]|jgi:hypothetical protein
MKITLSKLDRDALLVHLVFVASCILVLIIPFGIAIGIKLFILIAIYNLLIVIVGIWKNYKEWLSIWIFAFIISIFQVFPDWILSAEFNILVFPEDGLFKIGTVSGYMLGLWAIPLFIILFIGLRVQDRISQKAAYLSVVLLSLLIFGGSEQSMWMLQSWYAQNVIMIGHVAIYIIIPEIMLGLFTYYCYEMIKEKSHLFKIPVGFIIMIIYSGSAIFFYFLIERVIFP